MVCRAVLGKCFEDNLQISRGSKSSSTEYHLSCFYVYGRCMQMRGKLFSTVFARQLPSVEYIFMNIYFPGAFSKLRQICTVSSDFVSVTEAKTFQKSCLKNRCSWDLNRDEKILNRRIKMIRQLIDDFLKSDMHVALSSRVSYFFLIFREGNNYSYLRGLHGLVYLEFRECLNFA